MARQRRTLSWADFTPLTEIPELQEVNGEDAMSDSASSFGEAEDSFIADSFRSVSEAQAKEDEDERRLSSSSTASREAAQCLEDELPTLEETIDMLAKLPHFRRCARPMIEQVSLQAKRITKSPGDAIPLADNGTLYVVIAGSVEACVGPGPKRRVGKGAAFNSMGFFGLYGSAESFRPRRRTLKEDSFGHPHSDALRSYECLDYPGNHPVIFAQGLADYGNDGDKLCFFNTCPFSCPLSVRSHTLRLSNWMSLSAVAARSIGKGREGGAILMTITIGSLDDVRRSANTMVDRDVQIKKSIEQFRENTQHLTSKWLIIMGKFGMLFPEAPPDALFIIAEICELISIEAGDVIVHEGETGEAGEALYVIEGGMATVEKHVGHPSGDCVTKQIGRLRTGAVIGDIALIGAGVPRAATVRAKTTVECIKLPASKLLETLSLFPGLVCALRDRCIATVALLQQELPTRTEVLAGLKLFTECNLNFVNELANECTRKTLLCGEVVMEEGCKAGTLYVLEYGRCNIETKACGVLAEVHMGNCFGERTLLGISKSANATIRVKTLAALVLALPQGALTATLERHQDEAEHFERMKATSLEGRIKGGQLSHIALFRQCSNPFIEALGNSVEMRSYMPGQTVCVQGLADECQMFVIAGGKVVVERAGQRLGEMLTGATFGELAMLGFVSHRTVTCRALTFCFMLMISRSGFLKALSQYPDQSEHFTTLDRRQSQKRNDPGVHWPCLEGAPLRLLYLLDLYTERWSSEGGKEQWTLTKSALLVSKGYLFTIDKEGKHMGTVRAGETMNLQALVNNSDENSILLQPSKECEASVMSRECLHKVIAEFPDEEEHVRSMIMEYLVQQACSMLGLEPGGVASLRLSPIFRALSDDFMQSVRKHLLNRIYPIGSDIISTSSDSRYLYIILSGKVRVEHSGNSKFASNSGVFGESVLLGTAERYTCTVKAETVCIVQALDKKDFDSLLQEFEDDRRIITQCSTEARHCTGKHLLHKALMDSSVFSQSHNIFTKRLSEKAESIFFAPGEVMIGMQEDGALSKSPPLYLVLAGQVSVESQLGVSLDRIRAVDVVGEAGAPGSDAGKCFSVCAWEDGLVYCARISQDHLEDVFEGFPDELDRIIDLFVTRQRRYEQLEKRRRAWLQETAVPALAQCSLFSGCSFQFLWILAIPLSETEHQRRQPIVVAGDPAHSMLIILEGSAALEAKGERVGVVSTGAMVGEVAMFGLLPARTITVRAVAKCRVLEVTSQALRHALTGSYGGVIGERLRTIVKERQSQVNSGMPLINLDIGVRADDLSVRAIALHAKRSFHEQGETWWPTADSDPCGAVFSIVVHGRVILEMAEKGRIVMAFNPGSLILEGLAAEYGANFRAETNCEVYQTLVADFRTATASVPSAQDWLYRFKLLDKEVGKKMQMRLAAIRGLTEGLAPHPNSEEIHAWKACRDRNIRRAKQMRSADPEKVKNLPRLSNRSTEDIVAEAIQHSSYHPSKKNVSLQSKVPGLSSYPGLRLPLLKGSQSESRISMPQVRRMTSSKSAVSLQPIPQSLPSG